MEATLSDPRIHFGQLSAFRMVRPLVLFWRQRAKAPVCLPSGSLSRDWVIRSFIHLGPVLLVGHILGHTF